MIGAAPTESRTFESAETLAQNVAEWLCALAQARDRDFAICLSGGSTPRRLYEWLATPAIASRFPWSRAHWFWGDERFVPHNDLGSNYRMARDAFLSRVSIPSDNIHAIPTEGLSPEQAADAYEAILRRLPRRRHTCSQPAALRRDAARNWRGRTYGLIVSRAAGIARKSAVGGCGHRRKIRAAHHTDLPSARQQPRCRIPGDGRRKTGRCHTRPGWRWDDTRSHDSSGRASALVYGPRRGTRRSGLMSMETRPTEVASPPLPRWCSSWAFRDAGSRPSDHSSLRRSCAQKVYTWISGASAIRAFSPRW